MSNIIGQVPSNSLLGQLPNPFILMIEGFLIFIIVFLAIRELVLWYWRVNENTESLKKIANSLEIIAEATSFSSTDVDKKDDVKIIKPITAADNGQDDSFTSKNV